MLKRKVSDGEVKFLKHLIVLCAALGGSQASADLARGKEVFEVCEVCHGEQGQGNEGFESPKLAGQRQWYLLKQLSNFKAGIRGTHPDDENGQVMRPQAVILSDEDIESVVDYILTLDPDFVDDED